MSTNHQAPFTRVLVPLDGSRLAEWVLPLLGPLSAGQGAKILLLHILERAAPPAVHGEPHLTSLPEATRYLGSVSERLHREGVPAEYHVHEAPEGDVARSIVAHSGEEPTDLIVLATHGSGGMRDLLYGSIAQQVLNRGIVPVLLTRPESKGEPHPFQPRKILVPLDGTQAAEAALGPAARLATILGAGLHLVMVVPTQETLSGNRVAAATLLPSATRAALDLEQQEATRYLDRLARQVRAPGLPVTIEVRRGSPASALAQEATEPDVGLTVVATHGRTGLQAAWAGSVTSKLLARTRAPVLLLRIIEE